MGGADNITLIITGPAKILVNGIYTFSTSAIKSEERLQTAKLETGKLGSFVAVCSIAAQALNSSTNNLGSKAPSAVSYSRAWYRVGQATTPTSLY